jgi:hypothetical protein
MSNNNENVKMHVWKFTDSKQLKLAGSGPSEGGRKFFSTQNPNNPTLFFTGTPREGAEIVKVGLEKEASILSINNRKNMIR